MERVKKDKFALILFVATIVMVVSFVISIFTISAALGMVESVTREQAAGQGLSEDEINFAISIAKGAIVAALVISGIIILFVALCGFKCSLQGKWRMGAIVFGVIFTIDAVYTFFNSMSNKNYGGLVSGLISLAASVCYLIGAVKTNTQTITYTEPETVTFDDNKE